MKLSNLKRSAIILFFIMLGIFLAGIWYANYYYEGVNTSEDPRVRRAKELYQNYNVLAEEKKYDEILNLLDSIEWIYSQFDDYKDSYEVAVLYNNRAAIFLNLAIFEQVSSLESDSLILSADSFLNRGIGIYETWNTKYTSFTEEEFLDMLNPIYYEGLPLEESSQIEKYIRKRTDEMMQAQKEMNRRLSVAYTNLGIVYRHQDQIEKAVACYQMAIDLWEDNITAENNINILLGRPLKQRSFLDRLFPSEK